MGDIRARFPLVVYGPRWHYCQSEWRNHSARPFLAEMRPPMVQDISQWKTARYLRLAGNSHSNGGIQGYSLYASRLAFDTPSHYRQHGPRCDESSRSATRV